MSQPDDESQEALKRLQDRLNTFDGQRAPKSHSGETAESSMGDGYRLLGEVIGGVLGGLGGVGLRGDEDRRENEPRRGEERGLRC